ncbi:MAG TPA: hypothetical protein VGV34_02750, partial [Solirubrobacterales bacterium]|nr:hypothetical protein [Solirubrobacterales bacterium]
PFTTGDMGNHRGGKALPSRRGQTVMARISKLSTEEEFALEARRETFRERRWRRYRNVILTFAFVVVVLSGKVPPLISLLLHTP